MFVHFPTQTGVRPLHNIHKGSRDNYRLTGGTTVHVPNSEKGSVHGPNSEMRHEHIQHFNSTEMRPNKGIHVPNSKMEPGTTVHMPPSNPADIGHGKTVDGISSVNQTVAIIPVIHKLSNVVIHSKDVHHIFSAYYDSRELPNRPCIVLFGFIEKERQDKEKQDNMFCTVVYEDNTTKCLGEVTQTLVHLHDKRAITYICRLHSTDEIPTHIILCAKDKCESCDHSKRIPVWNRDSGVKESVGVCIEGPLYTSQWVTKETMFELILEFLAMVKVLGVKIVTIYNTNGKHELLMKILKLYPELVDMVQWNKPVARLHYHGQSMLLQDCLYRNMYRVKYLAFIDLDEMIFPVSSNNWIDMLQILEAMEGTYASYRFSNNFFAPDPSTTVGKATCPYMKTPKYFVRLQRLPSPDPKERTKVIVKPDLLEAVGIHEIGPYKVVQGYSHTGFVPKSIGMMGHYRIHLTRDMIRGKPVEDRTAMKYKHLVMQELERVCSGSLHRE